MESYYLCHSKETSEKKRKARKGRKQGTKKPSKTERGKQEGSEDENKKQQNRASQRALRYPITDIKLPLRNAA